MKTWVYLVNFDLILTNVRRFSLLNDSREEKPWQEMPRALSLT